MFEYSAEPKRLPDPAPFAAVSGASGASGVSVATVETWICGLASAASLAAIADDTAAGLVNRLRVLEELKAAASAAQARAAAALDASVRRSHERAGIPREQQGRGVAAQVALARRESPARGNRILGFAKALAKEMPCTLRALSEGRISEWRATLLVRETACLSLEDRRLVDREVAADPAGLEGLGDGRLIGRIRKITQRIDQEALVRRAAKAEADRYVSCRPAPDTMTYLTGLLPVAQGVAVYAALSREADSLRARGDTRGRGQIMADTMVERITGLSQAGRVPLEVQLVMTDRTLLTGSKEPAYLSGYGLVPAAWAKETVAKAAAGSTVKGGAKTAGRGEVDVDQASIWLRRLYTAPSSGELIAMDSKARRAPDALVRLIQARDQACRTPWCSAPIRHIDHIQQHRAGGSTEAGNLQGLCEACNQAKEAPGWTSVVVLPEVGAGRLPQKVGDRERQKSRGGPAGGSMRHTVEISTPTGHRYRSTAPPLPGSPSRPVDG